MHIAAPIAPIVVVDFDRDGNLDIVGAKGDGSISLWLGAGDGTFAHARDFPGGEGPPQLAVADLNGDERLDIVLTHFGATDAGFTGSDDVVVLLAKKDGTFKRLVRPAGSGPTALAIGDFNNDGKPDLATANNADHASVFVGHGDGTFDDPLDVPISAPPSPLASQRRTWTAMEISTWPRRTRSSGPAGARARPPSCWVAATGHSIQRRNTWWAARNRSCR